MAVLIPSIDEVITVPKWVSDLRSFRRWFRSDHFPSDAKVVYYDGNIWVDQQMERYLHTYIKTEIAGAIREWAKAHLPGATLCDKLRYTDRAADLSCEPDVIFVTDASLENRTVKLMDGDTSLEVEGSPEIIVEVISPTSVVKDEKTLREKYWQAGVQEYWLADSRKVPTLSILKRTARGFVTVKANAQGWLRSEVLGALCRLVSRPGPAATTKVELEMK